MKRNRARKLLASPIDKFLISNNASSTVKWPGISSEPCRKYPIFTLWPRFDEPDKAGMLPIIVFNSVVLPIPLFPIIAVVVPRSISMSGTSNNLTLCCSVENPIFRLFVLITVCPVRVANPEVMDTFCSLDGASILSILLSLFALPRASLDL